jgi:hypothetical protein
MAIALCGWGHESVIRHGGSIVIRGRGVTNVRAGAPTNFYPCTAQAPAPHAACAQGALANPSYGRTPSFRAVTVW